MKQNTKRIAIFSLCCAVFLFLTGGILWFITGSTEKERAFSNEYSIFTDGKLLLNRNFPWGFYPHRPTENGNSLEIGSFYWKTPGKRTSGRWEAMTKRCAVTLSLYTPQGENLFEDVNGRIHAFRDGDRESKVFLLVDGNSSVTCLLRLDLGEEEHWLYLQQGDLIYQLYARMNVRVWQDFLWCFYEKGEPWIDGQKVWEGESLLNAKDGEEGQYFCWRDFCYPFSWYFLEEGGSAGIELTDYAHRENGFSLTARHFNTAEKDTDFLEEFTLQALKEEPDFDTEEEALAYYLERHPEMTAYEAYVRLKRKGEKEFLPEPERAFRSIEEGESQCLYFAWNDGFYQACGSGKGNLALISYTRLQLPSALARRYSWKKHEGGISWKNFYTGRYDFEQDMGDGNIFVFHMEPDLSSEAAEASGLTEFVVEVSKKGEKEPFQVFETLCEGDDPFLFRDFNGDGYPDLNVYVWAGSNWEQGSRYLWSPSAGQFVQGPKELELCWMYKVDPDTRRLSMHYLYDYLNQSCDLYQWSGEMEYEKIRTLDYRESWSEEDDLEGIRVLLVEYIRGRKHTLMDYVYEEEKLFEDEELDSLIWDSFYSDYVWEKQIEDPDTGDIYTIRYTQMPKRDEEEEKIPGVFDAAVYVYGKDTDLRRRISYETAAPYTELVWEEEEGSLKVLYEDGSETVYTLEQIRGGM